MIEKNYNLRKLSTIGLGGRCYEYSCPEDIDELKYILQNNNKKKLIIGNGSNICFVTEYYDGVIISLKKMRKSLHQDDNHIFVSSNVSCTKLARYAHSHKVSGYEFLYGIPGTIGGAIFMNAGAFNRETLELVKSIQVINLDGNSKEIDINDLPYQYRNSFLGKNNFIISVTFNKTSEKFKSNVLKDLNLTRKESQPTNKLSCGCIFKNPNGHFASKLIDDANLKGKRFGGIYVSNKHANYFINDGSGTVDDFLLLLNYVKTTIKDKYSIQLEEEVILVK